MSRYSDATGYLIDLRNTLNEAWFHALCDMAISNTGQQTSDEQLSQLWNMYLGLQPYVPTAATPIVTPTGSPTPPAPIFLERLFDFGGFKKLTPSLNLQLDKQVTLVFGRNGSGKSSICQALKILANRDSPNTPIHNARTSPPRATPSFKYRLRNTPSDITWTQPLGYGTRSDAIKYFDSTVAIRHATGTLEPDAAVEVVVFRLEVFDYARTIAQTFQRYAGNRIATEKQFVQSRIDQIKATLAQSITLTNEPFASWSPTHVHALESYVSDLPEFTTAMAEELDEHRRQLAHFQTAGTEEGLRSMQAENVLLAQLEAKLLQFIQFAQAAPLQQIATLHTSLVQKQAALSELSRRTIPSQVDSHRQHALISSASAVIDLSAAISGTSQCPLCFQNLDDNAVAIFGHYHNYLHSTLQQEASAIELELAQFTRRIELVRNFVLGDFSSCQRHFRDGFIASLSELISVIIQSMPETHSTITQTLISEYQRIGELSQYLGAITQVRTNHTQTISMAQADRQALANQIGRLQQEIEQLTICATVSPMRQQLIDTCTQARQQNSAWASLGSYNFTSLYSSLTRKGREAHTELVRDAFEQRLDTEYQLLCGASMQQMGVHLKSIGAQQEIVVSPLVGDDHVHRVFSEGEQKVHALAVFMCEASLTPHQILVFDDPVTSFDYNNVSNLAERLRNLVRTQPNTQMIILTHNWDFFINLQTTLNRSGLESRLSVQVLEDCATVAEYTEQWSVLCTSIDSILNQTIEPTPEQKEKVSGLMRRLIERLNNAYVFNEQRHQYKPKTLQISDFHKFTKLVPLLVTEANDLRDLYANLSPPEHDDVRNFYLTKTKAQFATWYSQIQSIAAAVQARRPL